MSCKPIEFSTIEKHHVMPLSVLTYYHKKRKKERLENKNFTNKYSKGENDSERVSSRLSFSVFSLRSKF